MPTARRTSLTYYLLLAPQIAEKGRGSEMGKSGELSAQIQEGRAEACADLPSAGAAYAETKR
jgi:hypothetical protein